MADFALLESPELISRKIWVIEKSWNFHTVFCDFSTIYPIFREFSKINIPYFFSGRAGSEVDLKAVTKTFTNLGFDVNVHKNLNFHDIMNVLQDVSTVMDHSRSDCFVMILQSHGQHGTVYAYDAPFPIHKLWEPFTADKSPTLAGKPKLFFIQVNYLLHTIGDGFI